MLEIFTNNMKWIKSRRKFITEEAKLRDVIMSKQIDRVKSQWGEKYLDYEEIDATENIKQGRWKLSEEDKRAVLGTFLTADLDNVFKIFENLPVKFVESLNASVDLDLLKGDSKWEKILNNFDISKPSINQISVLTDAIFRKISVGETQASEIILRDETGRPVMGEDGRPQKVRKIPGEIVYSKNLTNINAFVEDFNRCFPDSVVDASSFTSGDISREDFSGEGYQVEVDVYGRDMYLSIQHKAKDILNMSISRFYSSCQNLYTGGQKSKILGNVFDPNSIPAFLLFDSSIHNERGEHISDVLPVSRMIIRNIESYYTPNTYRFTINKSTAKSGDIYTNNKKIFTVVDSISGGEVLYCLGNGDPILNNGTSGTLVRTSGTGTETIIFTAINEPQIFFDRAYPDRMKDLFSKIIEKYSPNKENYSTGDYLFTPDVQEGDESDIIAPYMDRLGMKRGKYIGVNANKIYLNASSDWSKTKISPKAKVKEVVIETTSVPKNFFDLQFSPDWIKFKFISILSAEPFKNFKTTSIAFDKCKFNNSVLLGFKKSIPDIKKIQINSCDIEDLSLSKLEGIDELHLIYTLDPSDLKKALEGVSVKKLVLSGDLVSDNKDYIKSLRSQGVKIEIVGPVI